ncbi:DNA invertase Pin-like site-specific DNA recombinase [Saccharopolyspora lacisalsi]|uniref:DNA invertase Pin-like site-specific DNA recombinase n=1 Tax=Halosaccharopolyspora lacisalsi TaxID=1000566 RepID=A0A839DQQ4_9PSEU|nr:hypothetical protein [Halosaccharopolyspora lacisalsi]MBA8823844.1 DNA invertase Pin-like site-specific DNA recombinase [Halosaccharopolyspora lacisalsi]
MNIQDSFWSLPACASGIGRLGVADERISLDHGLAGTTRARPGLDQALAAVRTGDTLVAPSSTDWLGRCRMLARSAAL